MNTRTVASLSHFEIRIRQVTVFSTLSIKKNGFGVLIGSFKSQGLRKTISEKLIFIYWCSHTLKTKDFKRN